MRRIPTLGNLDKERERRLKHGPRQDWEKRYALLNNSASPADKERAAGMIKQKADYIQWHSRQFARGQIGTEYSELAFYPAREKYERGENVLGMSFRR